MFFYFYLYSASVRIVISFYDKFFIKKMLEKKDENKNPTAIASGDIPTVFREWSVDVYYASLELFDIRPSTLYICLNL